MIETDREIILEEEDYETTPAGGINVSIIPGVPRKPVKEGEKWIKHVRCDGARFHVLSYGGGEKGAITHCSETDCIINKTGSLY
ncbi:MAG: hypothetical protein ABIA11_04070 [Patescibacteria group bacterium]